MRRWVRSRIGETDCTIRQCRYVDDKLMADERRGCLGVYGTTVEPGEVAVNDEVLIEPTA